MAKVPTTPPTSIAQDSAIDTMSQVGIAVFSVVTGIVLARMLGAQGRGEYVFATVFAGQVSFALTNFGLEIAGRVLAARHPGRSGELHTLAIASSVVVGAGAGALILFFQDAVRTWLFPGIALRDLLLVCAALPFAIYQYAGYGILVGLGEVRRRAAFDLAFSGVQNIFVLAILLAFSFSGGGEPVRALVLSYYGVTMAGALILFGIVRWRGGALALPGLALAREYLGFGFWIWLGNLGSYASQRVDEYLVKSTSRSDYLFGVYTLATSLTARTRIFPEALTRSAYARVCAAPTPEAALLVAGCFRQMVALGLVVGVVGAAVSPLIPVIYGPDFAAAVVPFLILLVGRFFGNCGRVLAIFISGHLARPRIPAAINWLVLPVQIPLCLWMLNEAGIVGAALAASAVLFLLCVVFAVLFLRLQDTVGLGGLLRLGREDFAPWRRMFRRGGGAA